MVLDELGGNSSRSSVAADFQNKALILDNELLTLSLERNPKYNKDKLEKPISVSHYKPEPWIGGCYIGRTSRSARQLNLATVSNYLCITYLLLYYGTE